MLQPSIKSGSLGDVIEFMTWNNLVAKDPHNDHIAIYYASNIRNNNVTDVHPVHSKGYTAYTSLYIPLTQSFNISDIQSFVLYNRFYNNRPNQRLRNRIVQPLQRIHSRNQRAL